MYKITAIITLIMSSQFVFALGTGDVVGKHIFGLARDYQADPVVINNEPLIYTSDPASLDLALDDAAFRVSLFDASIGSIYLTRFENNRVYTNTEYLDLSEVQGLSRPVSPVLTNWNSVIFSEAALVDVANADSFKSEFMHYFKTDTEKVKPYNYGWIGELVVFDAAGNAKAIKNYAMGRVAASQVLPMPDNRTFYLLDADNSGNTYVFVADKEKTMTQGTLYLMHAQNSKPSYLKLGDASALKIKFRLAKAKFEDVFDKLDPLNGICPDKYQYINTVYGEECLSINKRYASFAGQLEPVRYAALAGAVPYVKAVSSLRLDVKANQLIFNNKNGNNVILSLVKNPSMNSDYIAEDRK